MKRFIFLLVLCCLTAEIYAQTAKEEIYTDIHRSASNFYAYPNPTEKITAPPKGYEPFYLSHYGRHGSRFLSNPEEYEYPLEIMKAAEQDGVLTVSGKQVLSILDSIASMALNRYGELTPLGASQHEGIAERMFRNYPEIFQGEAEIDARSTVVIRCILSMASECLQLQSMNPRIKIKNDASHHDMYYMNYEDEQFQTIRKSDEITTSIENYRKKHLHPERLMKALFSNEDYVRWKVDSRKLMSYLFRLASNMQSHETDLDLFPIFTKEECYNLWLIENYRWYETFGPSPLTKGKIPFTQANLLRNILDTADSCIIKNRNNATLRFGHEVCVLPLACLLELDNCNYQTSDIDHIPDIWRNYHIIPMACNIQFIFFRKKGNNDILVKVMLNEREMKLPVKSDIEPFYHWREVEKYYRKKIEIKQQIHSLSLF